MLLPIFNNSKFVIFPLPEIFVLYFKKYDYEECLTDEKYQEVMCEFLFQILSLARAHMYQIDRPINGYDLASVVNQNELARELFKTTDEYKNLLNVISKSAQELVTIIGDHNYEGNKMAVRKFDENSIYVEIEIK